uniref:Uncharacterized protein n=1 Tax=Oryza barthii TaxID=65489 RepID=A0A0D3ELB6_9ORYZ
MCYLTRKRRCMWRTLASQSCCWVMTPPRSPITASMPGTFGYMAPAKYGSLGKASCKSDSSLESDLWIDRLFVGEVAIRQWVNQAFSAKLVHVLDDKLQLDESSIEDLNHLLLPIFEVGLLCSSDSPDQRMSMADVVVTPKKIRKDYEKKLALY